MTLIEKVARAIWNAEPSDDHWDSLCKPDLWHKEARAAIQTVLREISEWELDNCTSFHAAAFAKAHDITLEDGNDRE